MHDKVPRRTAALISGYIHKMVEAHVTYVKYNSTTLVKAPRNCFGNPPRHYNTAASLVLYPWRLVLYPWSYLLVVPGIASNSTSILFIVSCLGFARIKTGFSAGPAQCHVTHSRFDFRLRWDNLSGTKHKTFDVSAPYLFVATLLTTVLLCVFRGKRTAYQHTYTLYPSRRCW